MLEDVKIYDIESYHNFFCVGVKDYETKKTIFLEISEEKNNLKEIYGFFTNFNGFLVSVNGIHYDNIVIKSLLKNYNYLKTLNYLNCCKFLKKVSDDIILDDYEKIKEYKWFKTKWTDIDLFCYWSRMLRISKKISLKSLAVQLGYPVIQELPYHPNSFLKIEDLPKLRYYNRVHDLGITEMLFDKMKGDVDLRAYILQEYKLPCWSMDAPKIASEYLLEYFCKNTFTGDVYAYEEYKKSIRDSRYLPNDWIIGDYLPNVDFKTEFFKNIYENIKKSLSTNQYADTPIFKQKSGENVKLSISSGGIHTENNNQIFKENEEFYILDADVQGLYPTLFRHYKFIRKDLLIILDKYVQMIDDRTDAKRKGEKKKDTFLKLCNNAFSGLVDSTTSWLYSPEHILALRVFGQLIQLRFIEELNEVGITTLFSNTDGTLVKCPKHLVEEYHKISNKISKEFKITWEFCKVKSISFVNTNTYISVIEQEYMLDENLKKINVKDKEKIKRKGFCFKYDEEIPLGDSVDEQVVAKSLSAYLINGITPDEFISNPEKYNLHIYDYCKSNKIDKKFKVIHNGQVQQQLNRYYFSKNAPYLYKQKPGGKPEHVNVGKGVILFNVYEKKEWKDYKINYKHYIEQAEKIIVSLNNKNQLSLF